MLIEARMKNKTMKIQVLGSSCPTCKKLFELTKQAVNILDLKIEVEYIADIQKIVEMGVMSSPVLGNKRKTCYNRIFAGYRKN